MKPQCLRAECGPWPGFTLCPSIHIITKDNPGKTTIRVAEKCLAEERWARFVPSTWPPFYGRLRLACWPQTWHGDILRTAWSILSRHDRDAGGRETVAPWNAGWFKQNDAAVRLKSIHSILSSRELQDIHAFKIASRNFQARKTIQTVHYRALSLSLSPMLSISFYTKHFNYLLPDVLRYFVSTARCNSMIL